MILNICPIKDDYRGTDRSLSATDLLTKATKTVYEELLELYYQSITYTYDYPPSKSIIEKLIVICKEFKKYAINCELIVYDTTPLTSVFDYIIEFLGVDVTFDGFDFAICENTCTIELNGNKLFNTLNEAKKYISFINDKNIKFEFYYVYKIIC